MLKDYAKTSPITFFSLPILIIGLLVLSYFLYSTFINNQIDARSAYLGRQVKLSIDKIDAQINKFNDEIPFLAEVDDLEQVFDTESLDAGKLRYRIKHLARQYDQFIDTIFVYDSARYYFIDVSKKNELDEGYGELEKSIYPFQFCKKSKIIHIDRNKSLAIVPTQVGPSGSKVYVAAMVDLYKLIKSETELQFIGDHGYKVVFSENMGFSITQRGDKMEYEFGLMKLHRQKVINDLLKHQQGRLIHTANRKGHVFLTVYEPFELFSERFGLIYSVSDQDFIDPIGRKLQIIFISFFLIIAVIIVVFVVNLRDIGRNTDELEQSREGLARALIVLEAQQENSRDGLMVADENMRLVSMNKKLLRLFTFPEKPEKGMEVPQLLESLANSCKECLGLKRIKELSEQNSAGEVSEEILLKNGKVYDFYSSPITDEMGNFYGRIWAFRDVTNRKHEIEELKKAEVKAQEGAQEKENFLSTMSHEIRTPLNSIVGFANLLLEDEKNKDLHEQLLPLKYSADSLLNLINDILDLTKIESGGLEFERVNFSLVEQLQKAKHVFKNDAQEKEIGISLELDEKLDSNYLGDYNRLNQVVFNLIGNAIKFTEKGKVTIGCKVVKSEPKFKTIEIFVEDTGIGIEQKKLDLIFNSFSQADSNTTREYGGTGLGLAISKKLVELQGGQIGVESELGKGSKFWFRLDFEPAEKLENKEEQIEPDQNLNGKQILLVEDNPFNQKVAQKFLSRWGAEITVEESGEDALETLKTRNFDVILMDLQMPGMDGYETSLAIRALIDAEKAHIPIIAMSADALGDVQEKVNAAQMNGYISKPFDPKELLRLLSEA